MVQFVKRQKYPGSAENTIATILLLRQHAAGYKVDQGSHGA